MFIERVKIISVLFLVVLIFCGFSDPRLAQIESAILAQDFQTAKKRAVGLIDLNPEEDVSLKAQYYLAISLLRLGKYEESRKSFLSLTKIIIPNDLHDRAFLGLSDAYYLQGSYQEAASVLNRLLDSHPQSNFLSSAYFKLARVNLKLANWAEADAYLKKVIYEFPHSMEVSLARQFASEKHYFAVQVGSFRDRQKAEQLTNELKRKGEYAYIVETIDHKVRKFYRVRVGQLALLNEAKKLKSRLSLQGYPTKIYP